MKIIESISTFLSKFFSNLMLTIANHSIQETKLYRYVRNSIIISSSGFFLSLFITSKSETLNIFSATLWLSAMSLLIYIWFYYAPLVIKNICNLKQAFPENNQYEQLYISYMNWQQIFKINPFSQSGRFKIIYILFWIGDFLTALYLAMCQNPFGGLVNTFATSLLTLFVLILNFSSYYICIIFVFFLIKLSKINHLNKIPQPPSLTHGFYLLNDTANMIFLYFLLDSILVTSAIGIFWYEADLYTSAFELKLPQFAFWYTFFFTIIGTLISWIVICLLSRAYLYKLHSNLKLEASIELQAEYNNIATSYSRKSAIINTQEKLYNDKMSIDIWNVILALITLLANLATIINITNPDFLEDFFPFFQKNFYINYAKYIFK